MSVFKEPSEIIETAIRIEREGVKFYKNLSENAEYDTAKDVFSFLAAEEEKHIGAFRELLDEAAHYTPKFSYPGEYGVFLDELASLALDSFQKYETAKQAKGFAEAISFGIQVELESILYYKEICEQFPDKQKVIIQKVIDEEKRHLLELKAIREKQKL